MLELRHVDISDEYKEKWDIYLKDFLHLYKDGKLLRNTLYRLGGLNNPNLEKDRFFKLLKHTEDYYEDSITTDPKEKPHLNSTWCILDSDGVEKIVAGEYESIYIIEDSIVYNTKDKYYNIETGELYCNSYKIMTSSEFLFLDNKYDDDKTKRGIWQINKKDGSYTILK